METSAKTGLNTQEIFVEAARVLYFDYMKYKRKNRKPSERVKLEKDVVKKCSELISPINIIHILYKIKSKMRITQYL